MYSTTALRASKGGGEADRREEGTIPEREGGGDSGEEGGGGQAGAETSYH